MNKEANINRLEHTLFYELEKAIKSYRQYAQRNIKTNQIDITIDQWLLLKAIKDNPELSQKEIAGLVFKDYASITRMIELMVQKKYLIRSFHEVDRRRFKIELTAKSEKLYGDLVPIILSNRGVALKGLSEKELSLLSGLLQRITNNCTE
ncbi:MAG: MarR family transcriptional regulator for hemolysin [Saprospiraceae bacterium]|jgi:MarR family transcriptional regulator for hemolysin